VGVRVKPVYLVDWRGRKIRIPQVGKVTTVAFVGDCTECWAWVLGECRNFANNHPHAAVYAAVRKPGRDMPRIARHYMLKGRVVSENRAARARFNVWFEPRVYVFDKQGRLVYLQRPEDPTDYVKTEVGRVLEAAEGGS